MKAVILTKANSISYFAVNHLPKKHKYCIIVEDEKHLFVLIKKLKRFIKKNGFLTGFYLFLKFISEIPFLLKENRKTENYLKKRLKDYSYHCPVKKVESINSFEAINLIDKIDPKVIIDIGTGIIKKEFIEKMQKKGRYFVNWHMGITPKYRGCQSEFRAVYNDDIENAGSTLHFLDEGVDTGKIIMQKRVKLESDEKRFQYNFRFLKYKNTLLGVNMLNDFFKKLEKDGLVVENIQSSSGRCYSTPGRGEYREYYEIFCHCEEVAEGD